MGTPSEGEVKARASDQVERGELRLGQDSR